MDINTPVAGGGFVGITLTYNVERREEVDDDVELVRAVGGAIVKEPQEAF